MNINKTKAISFISILLIFILMMSANLAHAQNASAETLAEESNILDSVDKTPEQAATLTNLLHYKSELLKQIISTKKTLKRTSHPTDKETLSLRIKDLEKQLQKVHQNFIKVATGLDVSMFNEEVQQHFQWQEEIETLVKPILHELKEMTKRPRQIERLKSRVAYFESRLPNADEAVENLKELINSTDSLLLKAELDKLKIEFIKKRTNISNQLDVAHFELNELQKEKKIFF